MKVFINPGHDRDHDPGACNWDGTHEADIAWEIGIRVKEYLDAAGCETMILQSDNLNWDSSYDDRQDAAVVPMANDWPADVFVSIHCNACGSHTARGTEVESYGSEASDALAQCIQSQIVNSIGTVDRGVKQMPQLLVLRTTDMPSCLVETAFIDNDEDCQLLKDNIDAFAAAIARGVTDYECQCL